jgi:integrase
MASINETQGKHGTSWVVTFRHNGKQRGKSFRDERAAKLFRDEINATAERPGASTNPLKVLARHGIDLVPVGGPTVAEWVEVNIAKGRTRDKTKVKYRQILANDIAPAFTNMRLRRLTFSDVDRWIKSMEEKGTSAKTIRNKYVVLSAALNYGVRLGEIAAHPCAQEDDFLPEVHKTKKRILRPEEFRRLRDAMISDTMKLFLEFLITSGCRFSEVTALQPADVDTAEGTVYIHQAWEWLPVDARTKENPGPYLLKDHPKTPTSTRTIHIPHQMLERLKDAGLLDPARKFVFLNEDGNPIRQYTFKNMWKLAVKRSGLTGKPPTIKDLRATFACWEIKAKVDPLVVQNHMGHANIGTTLTWYAEYDLEESRAAADERGKRLFG